MPVSYSFQGPLLRLDLVGKHESREVTEAFAAALQDLRCPPRVDFLVDVSRSESLETRSHEDIRRTSEFLAPYVDRIGGRMAVIAKRDVHFGLSRMGSVYTEGVGIETAVFRDEAAAIQWLRGGTGA